MITKLIVTKGRCVTLEICGVCLYLVLDHHSETVVLPKRINWSVLLICEEECYQFLGAILQVIAVNLVRQVRTISEQLSR